MRLRFAYITLSKICCRVASLLNCRELIYASGKLGQEMEFQLLHWSCLFFFCGSRLLDLHETTQYERWHVLQSSAVTLLSAGGFSSLLFFFFYIYIEIYIYLVFVCICPPPLLIRPTRSWQRRQTYFGNKTSNGRRTAKIRDRKLILNSIPELFDIQIAFISLLSRVIKCSYDF